MKTAVYQSFRTFEVPPWVERCMKTVKAWAEARGFDYHFIDDRMFGYVPAWYRQKASNNIMMIANLARLNLAKEFLSQGYERSIWVDADIVVFDPDQFITHCAEEYAFCHEVWVVPGPDGKPQCSNRVNNAVTMFTRGSVFLDFYIDACQRIVAQKAQVSNFDVGTWFLTSLRAILPFPLFGNIGLFSPLVMADLVSGPGECVQAYMRAMTARLCAANLCTSVRNRTAYGVQMTDAIFDSVVERLLNTRGEILNRHRPPVSNEMEIVSQGTLM